MTNSYVVRFSHMTNSYVVVSRVKTNTGLEILILDEDGNVSDNTKNIVFKEIF